MKKTKELDMDLVRRCLREIEDCAQTIRGSANIQDSEYRARIILDYLKKLKNELEK